MYSLTVSVHEEFRSTLAVGSGSQSLKRLQVRCQPGLQSSEGLSGARGFVSKMVHADRTIGRRPQFLNTWTPPWVYLTHGPLHGSSWHGSWLLPEGVIVKRARWERQCLLWPHLGRHTSTNPIDFFRSVLFNVRGDYTKACIPGSKKTADHLGSWLPHVDKIMCRYRYGHGLTLAIFHVL